MRCYVLALALASEDELILFGNGVNTYGPSAYSRD